MTFARRFFEDKVHVERVIASREWYGFRPDVYGCTFAVVRFDEASARLLRDEGPKAVIGKGDKRQALRLWDVKWKPTPVFDGLDPRFVQHTAFNCLNEIPKRQAAVIKEALENEGSWYFASGKHVTFLSEHRRIAATFRYGD